MNGAGPVLIVFAFILLAGAFAYFAYQQAKQRREALAALAQQLGWSYDPNADYSFDERYGHFNAFTRGHDRHAYNLMQGNLPVWEAAMPAVMGDFEYKETSGSGKDRRTTTYNFSFLIVDLPGVGIPPLFIRPENFLDKIAGALGFDDIDFESAEFSRRFLVKSPDKKFAYDVIDPRMMEFLLQTSPRGIEINGGQLLVSDGSRSWTPNEFAAAVEWTRPFLDRWPNHVRAALGVTNTQ